MAENPAGGNALLAPVQERRLGLILLLGGLVGFVAAFVLSYERIQLLLDPSYVPSCSINPVVACGSVMSSEQASAFGFPNPFIGVAAFPVVMLLGALLLSRVPLPRWVFGCLQVGTLLGTVFVGWLISQSLYDIGALCPYCMAVWAVVIPMFVTTTAYCLQERIVALPQVAAPVVRMFIEYRSILTALAYTTIVVLILVRFWYYWSTLLP